ncbi:hypothetical protein EVA_17209 [gut metagenome]|uniref:Uncharacterized protein n=1 Tax=gut metagenome TaxID=749906 RepID=J9G598_9ZZZZ
MRKSLRYLYILHELGCGVFLALLIFLLGIVEPYLFS